LAAEASAAFASGAEFSRPFMTRPNHASARQFGVLETQLAAAGFAPARSQAG